MFSYLRALSSSGKSSKETSKYYYGTIGVAKNEKILLDPKKRELKYEEAFKAVDLLKKIGGRKIIWGAYNMGIFDYIEVENGNFNILKDEKQRKKFMDDFIQKSWAHSENWAIAIYDKENDKKAFVQLNRTF